MTEAMAAFQDSQVRLNQVVPTDIFRNITRDGVINTKIFNPPQGQAGVYAQAMTHFTDFELSPCTHYVMPRPPPPEEAGEEGEEPPARPEATQLDSRKVLYGKLYDLINEKMDETILLDAGINKNTGARTGRSFKKNRENVALMMVAFHAFGTSVISRKLGVQSLNSMAKSRGVDGQMV